MNAPINTTENKFKRLRTVQGECPWNSDNKEACCCRGSRQSRPVKDCHNLRTQGQFCDNCKTINAERARAKKRRHCEKVARELLAKGATGVESSSMGLPATSEFTRTSAAHVAAPVLKEPEFLSVPPMLLDQGYFAAINPFMLDQDHLARIAAFAHAWPTWGDKIRSRETLPDEFIAKAKSGMVLRAAKKELAANVADSVHPERMDSTQYRLLFKVPNSTLRSLQAHDTEARHLARALVSLANLDSTLQESIDQIARAASYLLRRVDMPCTIELGATPPAQGEQAWHMDAIRSGFVALLVLLSQAPEGSKSTVFGKYPFVLPGEGHDSAFRASVPQEWLAMDEVCYTLRFGDCVCWHTSKVHKGPGNSSHRPRYFLFLAWPANKAALNGDTDHTVVSECRHESVWLQHLDDTA